MCSFEVISGSELNTILVKNKSVLKMENLDCGQQFDWNGTLVPVQGFGFLPSCVHKEMENRFQVDMKYSLNKD